MGAGEWRVLVTVGIERIGADLPGQLERPADARIDAPGRVDIVGQRALAAGGKLIEPGRGLRVLREYFGQLFAERYLIRVRVGLANDGDGVAGAGLQVAHGLAAEQEVAGFVAGAALQGQVEGEAIERAGQAALPAGPHVGDEGGGQGQAVVNELGTVAEGLDVRGEAVGGLGWRGHNRGCWLMTLSYGRGGSG